MKSFEEEQTELRRLRILRVLSTKPPYRANDSLIAMVVQSFSIDASSDQIRTDLHWLKENGLLEIEEIATVIIATLTQRGFETAQGIIAVPGVRRRSRGD